MKTSALPNFRRLDVHARRRMLADLLALPEDELAGWLDRGGLDVDTADKMVENAIGTLGLPFGVALNFRINGEDVLVPMAIEEPSVIAAASHAAKRVREGGGFYAETTPPLMIAQIEVHDVPDAPAAIERIVAAAEGLLTQANAALPGIVARGGGAREIDVRDIGGGMVVTHVIVDVCDAMGANMLNTVAEALGPTVASLAGGALGLRILSNYCDRRLVRVTASLPVESFSCDRTDGLTAARGVVAASRFAERDPYRAVTHNKGIMNGVDAVVLATGNDWRAIEAAAHAYAARSGTYGPLATWRLSADERTLEGVIEMPLALGVVGGALRAHKGAKLALALAGIESAAELAMIVGAAGLATNMAALRALATEGIQRGHMALHHRATHKPPAAE